MPDMCATEANTARDNDSTAKRGARWHSITVVRSTEICEIGGMLASIDYRETSMHGGGIFVSCRAEIVRP